MGQVTARGTSAIRMLWRSRLGAALPSRVLLEIQRREEQSERLVGWIQLLLVLIFGAFYLLGARAEGARGASFTTTILTIYIVFTLFRVWLSYRRVLPAWFLVTSIIADVGLLCALIVSFHVEYDQPAAFYLKAPTMIYLFIFISVRMLRFDPRFVLLTGLTATLGWFLLVVYALNTDMGDMHITHNYVEYLTSNTILIGAEVDRGIALLGVTFVLTLALYRARSVLVDAISGQTAAADLRQFFASDVADSITSAEVMPVAGMSRTHDVSILFVDLRGFTATAAALPGATVMAVLRLYQEAAVQTIASHGGQIDKFMGDGILATFGAVQDSITHAADAVRAARDVVDAVAELTPQVLDAGWPGPLRAGAAVSSGPVTVGVVGSHNRLEFTVIGHAVNMAAKLEGANKVESTRALTDQKTFALAVAQGYDAAPLRRLPQRRVAGLSDPVDLVVVA